MEEKSHDLYNFQSMFDYLDNTVIKLCDMSTVGTDLGTVKQQIEELKVCKTFVLQQCFSFICVAQVCS